MSQANWGSGRSAAGDRILGWFRDRFGFTGTTWPPPELREVWEEVERFIAFRMSDEDTLRSLESLQWTDRYMISPVPRLISRASANLLHGEPAEYRAASENDQDRLDFLVAENELDTEAHRAAMVSSSEGEVWGRILVRPDLLDAPIIEWISRRRVIPFFSGRFLTAAIFVTEWPIGAVEVMRLFEAYEAGAIRSQLFRGTRTSLGSPVALTAFSETKWIQETVLTGIDRPLVAFIPNSVDDDPGRGYSDYCGLEDRFFGINRATTIGDSNTELAGKKRALIDAEYVGKGGTISGDEIFIRDDTQGGLDEKSPMNILEFSYDSTQIVTWLDHLIDSTLSFGGAAPQLVGRQLDGAAVTGIALRLKMVHSLLEASGKGRFMDRGFRRLLHFAQIIDARPTFEIGFGRPWSKPDDLPQVQRQDGLPTDDLEAAQQVATLVGAESISVEERVKFLHPEWEQDRVDKEVKRLTAEAKAAMAVPIPSFPPDGPSVPDED